MVSKDKENCYARELKGAAMSFDINGPTPAKGIQEAQYMRNNGGGGNLGYFQRGKKKKKDEKEIDVFTPSVDLDDEFLKDFEESENKDGNLLDKVADKFKKFFGN